MTNLFSLCHCQSYRLLFNNNFHKQFFLSPPFLFFWKSELVWITLKCETAKPHKLQGYSELYEVAKKTGMQRVE